MTHDAPPSPSTATICPECGRAESPDRTPPLCSTRARGLRLWATLVAWLGWSALLVYVVGTSQRSARTRPPREWYLFVLTDDELDHAGSNAGRRDTVVSGLELYSSTYTAFERGTPIEFALTDGSLVGNYTPWMPSAVTPEDLLDPTFTDADLSRTLTQGLREHVGNDWNGPATEFISLRGMRPRMVMRGWGARWPVRLPYLGDRILAWSHWESHRSSSDPVWIGPSLEFSTLYAGDLWIRRENPSNPRAATLSIISLPNVLIVLGVPLLAPTLAWALIPPVWSRRRVARRHRLGLCLACGYPLPRAAPQAARG